MKKLFTYDVNYYQSAIKLKSGMIFHYEFLGRCNPYM